MLGRRSWACMQAVRHAAYCLFLAAGGRPHQAVIAVRIAQLAQHARERPGVSQDPGHLRPRQLGHHPRHDARLGRALRSARASSVPTPCTAQTRAASSTWGPAAAARPACASRHCLCGYSMCSMPRRQGPAPARPHGPSAACCRQEPASAGAGRRRIRQRIQRLKPARTSGGDSPAEQASTAVPA